MIQAKSIISNRASLRAALVDRFETTRGGSGKNLRVMEGLRGFSVLLVFFVHYATLGRGWVMSPRLMQAADGLQRLGNAGVDLFFVLSGFLIYGSLIVRKQPFLPFLRRRLRRIYPAFLVMFALYLVLSLLFPAENKIPNGLMRALPYLVANLMLLPGLFPIEPLITVAWSLSYEMAYYLAIPALIGALGLRQRSKALRVALFILIGVAIFGICAIFGGPVRLAMFIAGILLFETMGWPKAPALGSNVGFMALACGLLGTLLPLQGAMGLALRVGVIFVSFFLLCLACFRPRDDLLGRVFGVTPLRWLGNMSYSYYLMHGLALKFAFLLLTMLLPQRMVYGDILFLTMLPLLFLWTLIPSAMLYLLVERPFSLGPALPISTRTPPPRS